MFEPSNRWGSALRTKTADLEGGFAVPAFHGAPLVAALSRVEPITKPADVIDLTYANVDEDPAAFLPAVRSARIVASTRIEAPSWAFDSLSLPVRLPLRPQLGRVWQSPVTSSRRS